MSQSYDAQREQILDEDLEIAANIRNELQWGNVGNATELLEKISSFLIRREMDAVIRDYESFSREYS